MITLFRTDSGQSVFYLYVLLNCAEMADFAIELLFGDEDLDVTKCNKVFKDVLDCYESVVMGYGFGYDNLQDLKMVTDAIRTSAWQKSLAKIIKIELANHDMIGRGKVYEFDELLKRIIDIYEANRSLFDGFDMEHHLHQSLKYWEGEKERIAVELSEAMDVLKKSVTYEGMMALQALAGTRKWDLKSPASYYHRGADERFSRLIVEAESTVKIYNEMKASADGETGLFSFGSANQAFIDLRKIIDSESLFPMDELLEQGNEIVYEEANKNDAIFPKALNEAVCEACNGFLFKRVSTNAFRYAINHPHRPYPLARLKDQNNRIFFMIYALSRCLRPETGKLWVSKMLDVLDLKKSSYDSKATYCIGAYASTDDKAFVERMKEAFAKSRVSCTW